MRLLFIFFGISLSVLAIWLVWGGQWDSWSDVDRASQLLQSYGVSSALVGFALMVMDLVMPVPGTVVMSALGFLHGVILGGLIGFAGASVAGMLGYALGYACPQRWSRKFLGAKDYERGHRIFARGGGWMVAVSRAVPILPEALAVTAGMVRMPWRKFLLSMTCGNLPMAFVFAWVGASGKSYPKLAVVLSLALPAVLWAAAWWHERKCPM